MSVCSSVCLTFTFFLPTNNGYVAVTLQIKLVVNQQNVAIDSCSRMLEVAGTLYTVATWFLHVLK